MKEILPFATLWMNLEEIMLSEESQTEKYSYCMVLLLFRIFFLKSIYFGCAESSLLCRFFSSCGEWGLLCGCGAQASHPGDFSLRSTGSTVRGLHSCSTWAYLLRGTWDLLRSGIEPMSPAQAGRFFTTESLGNPFSPYLLGPRSVASSGSSPGSMMPVTELLA